MKIGIIGSGNVGGTLGTRLAQLGHQVVFSSRNPHSDEMNALVSKAGPTASTDTVAGTVLASDVLILATPWPATKAILETAAGSDGTGLEGKILVDATNPLLPNLAGLEIGTSTSGGELVASWAPGAVVVKAFNTVGYNIMADPSIGGRKALLYYCGDDVAANATVGQLATELGFDAQDAGPLTQSRLLEPFALLWIRLAFTKGHGREFAFQTISR